MMLRAFDWHPQVLTYIREVTHLANLFFAQDWVDAPPSSKELMFGSRAKVDDYRKVFLDLNEPNLFDYYGSFDCKAFTDAFTGRMGQPGDRLTAFQQALSDALLAASPRDAERYLGREGITLALKLPFFSEAYFTQLAKQETETFLLHMDREPGARYLSAKARTRSPRNVVHGVMDWTTYQALQPAASIDLAKQADRAFPGRVVFSSYEVARGNGAEMERIAIAIGVNPSEWMLKQTLHGMPQRLPSAYGFSNHGGATDDAERHRISAKMASDAEIAYVTLINAIARHESDDYMEALMLAAEPFAEENEGDRKLRMQFANDSLSAFIRNGTGASLSHLIRERRLGVL